VNPVSDPFQRRVVSIALDVAKQYGFALGGGCAWIAHDLVHRVTEDVDLFTDRDAAVQPGLAAVCTALEKAGFQVEEVPGWTELGETFEGFEEAFGELVVSDGAGQVRLSLACLPRIRPPLVLDIGPVLHPDDLIASKACALATRAEVRDFVDVAAALKQVERTDLVRLAATFDRGVGPDDFAAAARRLDSLDDALFEYYGLTASEIAAVRAAFADWPRST